MNIDMLINFVLLVIAVSMIFGSWQRKKLNKNSHEWPAVKLITWGGWLTAFACLWGWGQIRGAEFGATYWFIFLALVAWGTIFFNRTVSPENAMNRPYRNQFVSIKKIVKSFATFFLAGPLALVSSCLLTILVSSWLPMERANQLVLAAFIFPVLWALVSFWICATQKRLLPGSAVSLAAIVSGVLLFS